MTQPWSAEHDVSAEFARDLLASQFPTLTPATVEPLGVGWDNTALLVNDTYVFRFPRRQLGADCMESEIDVLPLLAGRLPLAIPILKFIGQPSHGYPWPFAGYPLIPGRLVCEAALTDNQRSVAAKAIGQFLRVLHGIPVDAARQAGAPPDTIGRLDLEKRVPQTLQRIDKLQSAGFVKHAKPYREIVDAVNLRFGKELAASNRPRTLVHGDLYSRQMLVDASGQLCGIIDWGDVHCGDPAIDLAIAITLLPLAARQVFAAEYGLIDKDTWLLARFRALNHTTIVVDYANSIEDAELLRESLKAMRHIADDD